MKNQDLNAGPREGWRRRIKWALAHAWDWLSPVLDLFDCFGFSWFAYVLSTTDLLVRPNPNESVLQWYFPLRSIWVLSGLTIFSAWHASRVLHLKLNFTNQCYFTMDTFSKGIITIIIVIGAILTQKRLCFQRVDSFYCRGRCKYIRGNTENHNVRSSCYVFITPK